MKICEVHSSHFSLYSHYHTLIVDDLTFGFYLFGIFVDKIWKFSVKKEKDEKALYNEYLPKIPQINGKVVAITGTTSGMGTHLAEIAINKGASIVLLLNRESSRAKTSEESLRSYGKSINATTKIQTVPCDMQNLNSVRTAAVVVNTISKQNGGLDVLICNAGIMAMNDERTGNGFDVQMQTNQLSHFLLCRLVFKSFKLAEQSRGEARLVMHTSSARDFPGGMLEKKYFEQCKAGTLGGDTTNTVLQLMGYPGTWQRYHQSKLANSCFAMQLSKLLSQKEKKLNIKALAADPGYARTSLATSSNKCTSGFAGYMERKGQSAEDGCLPAAMAAFSDDAESGDMYVPANYSKGKPIKSIIKGVSVKNGGEKLTCSEENMDLVWEACQSALNVDFVLD